MIRNDRTEGKRVVTHIMLPRMILVVEDDQALRNKITSTLRGEGFFVLALPNGMVVPDIARENPFALILLDQTLLQPDVIDLCRQLQTRPETEFVPLLMLVADTNEITRLANLGLGVSDYIVKPLQLEELRACVHTLLRSRRRNDKQKHMRAVPKIGATNEEGQSQVLVVDDLSIDITHRKVTRNTQHIELQRAMLFNLLVYLVRHRGVVLTREQLLVHVWGYEPSNTTDTRTVDVHVRWLRERLEEDPNDPKFILTVRGVGYRFKDE